MKRIITLILVFSLLLLCLNPLSVSAAASDMISFHISSTDDWSAVKFLSKWKTFPAGNYKATIKLKKYRVMSRILKSEMNMKYLLFLR